jgi:5-methylcytosine-specific restriction enzyme B
LVGKCISNPDKKFVLIIDEINRGNISKIFGELIYLLEYRNERIHLTYSSHEEFYLPDDLYLIGTMNSADRSIAFVD